MVLIPAPGEVIHVYDQHVSPINVHMTANGQLLPVVVALLACLPVCLCCWAATCAYVSMFVLLHKCNTVALVRCRCTSKQWPMLLLSSGMASFQQVHHEADITMKSSCLKPTYGKIARKTWTFTMYSNGCSCHQNSQCICKQQASYKAGPRPGLSLLTD